MKKIMVCLMVLAGFLLAADPIDGFRGIKFGDNVSKLGEYKLNDISSDSREKFYNKKKENLNIGSATLKFISYKFCDDKFCQVLGAFKDSYNFGNLEDIFTQKYGKPKTNDEVFEKQRAFGDISDAIVLLTYNEITQEGSFSIVDMKADKKLRDERNKAAVKDL